ncbi:MAG TPA: hypothetical protein VH591_20275 [Ktedonobacterales bacterium]|jgi:hypothetical protein
MVRRYIDGGNLRCYYILGGYHFFRYTEVEAFMRERDANPLKRGSVPPTLHPPAMYGIVLT